VNKEGAEVTSAGRAFQTRAPATEKARRPTVGSLTASLHELVVSLYQWRFQRGWYITSRRCPSPTNSSLWS